MLLNHRGPLLPSCPAVPSSFIRYCTCARNFPMTFLAFFVSRFPNGLCASAMNSRMRPIWNPFIETESSNVAPLGGKTCEVLRAATGCGSTVSSMFTTRTLPPWADATLSLVSAFSPHSPGREMHQPAPST